MSGKNQSPIVFNWQSASPVTGFLPLNANTQGGGSVPSGTISGTMTGTSTIYSQIIDISRMDNVGLEVTWTSTAVGTLSIMVSNSGINFYSLTFNPALTQPAGTAGGYAVDLNQMPFRYMFIKYVNTSSSGVLTVYGQQKDVN